MQVRETDWHRIVKTSAVLLGLTVLHDFDHVRQGRALDWELYGVGTLALVAGIVVLILALKRSSLAVPAAISLGIGTFVGVAAVHVAPTWWPLSDSYGDAGVDMLSWAIIIATMLVGMALTIQGIPALRDADGSSED